MLLASLGTGVLLICHAWFDLTTASGRDRWTAALSAALIELPLAALLLWMSYRLLSMSVIRHLDGANAPTLLCATWPGQERGSIKDRPARLRSRCSSPNSP